MGLIKTAFFNDNAYHRISSFQYHKDKEILRIRTDIYPTKAKEKILGSTEYQITEKNFIDNSRMEAEKSVDQAAIKKLVDKRIKELEKDKLLSQPEKELLLKEEIDFAITEKMKVMGIKKMENLFKEIHSKTFPLLYEILKKYSNKDELKDSKDS